MDTKINFKGAFLLHQPKDSVKTKMTRALLKNKKQVFSNFSSDGDVLYVTRKSADKKVAEILSRSKTKFEYYPELSTKSGFDDEKPVEAKKILENYKDKIITTVDELKKVFKLKEIKLGFSTKKKDNTLAQSIKALNIDMSDNIIKRRNGFNEIYTKNGDLIASISEPGQYGFRYARVEPITAGDDVKRYAIRGGEIQFTYVNNPDETLANGTAAFLKNYLRAVKENRFTHSAVHQ